jgi:multidrug efflux pump subunit AcrB
VRWALIGGAALVFAVLLSIHWLAALLLLATTAVLYAFHHYVGRPLGHWFMQRGLPPILDRYERLLQGALARRGRVLAGSLATLILVLVAFGLFNAGIEFFPENIPPNTVYVQVQAPLGTPVEETDRLVRQVEAEIRALPDSQDIESVVATVGSMLTADFGGRSTGSHLATVAVNLVDYRYRRSDAFEILERMRSTVGRDIAGADISVEVPNLGPPTGRPVTIEITGEDPDVLRALGDSVVRRLENAPVFAKLEGLENDLSAVRPELVVEVDREKAALYGLSTQKIGATIRSAINGTEASKYRDGKDEYDITVRLAKAYRENLDALADLTVMDEGTQVPLTSVARWYVGTGFADVKRKDLDRVATVSADVRTGYNANAVLAEVQQSLAGFPLPAGYRMRYAGQQEQQAESQAFLSAAFLIAIMLIGFILVAQFDSVTTPIIIMTSVIMSTVGVLIGLLIFRMPFGIIMTGVGVISLAGVVVNNAIVLLDYTNVLQRRDGLPRREAVVLAGRTRFRPVWLTAITTVLGLVPLAMGLNVDFIGFYTRLAPDIFWGGEQAAWWGPMAIAVIAGLLCATFLTLVLVPVLYSLFGDAEAAVRRWFRGEEQDRVSEPAGAVEAAGKRAAQPAVV